MARSGGCYIGAFLITNTILGFLVGNIVYTGPQNPILIMRPLHYCVGSEDLFGGSQNLVGSYLTKAHKSHNPNQDVVQEAVGLVLTRRAFYGC